MKHKVRMLSLAAVIAALSFTVNTYAEDLEALPLVLPKPSEQGTPNDIELGEYVEKPSDKPRPAFMAPKGVKNVALGKKVTSSDKSPLAGSYDLVVDGNKEATDEYLELHRKPQWIQIDLEKSHPVTAILVWHSFATPQVYRDVVVQGSDDPEFKDAVTLFYNNDYDNSLELGAGKDLEYFETHEGRLVDCKGKSVRYLRLYSNGSTFGRLNRYTEVEVWAKE
ncbi:MAG: discoidin domain-containing protein [Verrucomicrobia bacterium]|nr:discoidin domain-containing protein [Verrucomicrobiota bacterium]